MDNQDTTICAMATPPGGAIGIIRISGPEAIEITDRIFTPAGKNTKRLVERKGYSMVFGYIKDHEDEVIDEVLVSLFRAPHSYTGENSTEISCHGSGYIIQQILQLLIENGCRTARPGEYTQRAFLNGKMDLSQAEAVADLIASSSKMAHRMAMNQMRGSFSRELHQLRDKLLHLTSLLELELDFSDHEDLEFADRTELIETATQTEQLISSLVKSFSLGNAIKNGIPVAIIGETNAGKSTLLNALVGEEKAIVSEIHGTTRDVIEDTVTLDGLLFRFIDTAGIRDTEDRIESLGIERTFQKLSQAEIVIWMIDATCAKEQMEKLSPKIIPACRDKKLIIAYNKSDLLDDFIPTIPENFPSTVKTLAISAKENTNIEQLRKELTTSFTIPETTTSDVIVTNARHYDVLSQALAAIRRVLTAFSEHVPSDLVSEELRACINHLSEITGETISPQTTLNNIFKKFCIGK